MKNSMKKTLALMLALVMLAALSACRKAPPILLYHESYTAGTDGAEIDFDYFVDYGGSEIEKEDLRAVSKDDTIAQIDGSIIRITGKPGKTDIVFSSDRRVDAVLHIITEDHPVVTETAPEATAEIITEAETEEETAATQDDAELIKAAGEQLVGAWVYFALDGESLTFNSDGTGKYESIVSDANYSFTYTVSVVRAAYSNGREYTYNLMTVTYDNGTVEDITFDFREENGEKMVFHSGDYSSGYSGIINFDEWKRA